MDSNLSEIQRFELLSNLSHLLIGKGWNELKNEMVSLIDAAVLKALDANTKKDEEDYLTRKEAIHFLKCSSTTFYNYHKLKVIPHYQVGRKKLYKKSELLEHFKAKPVTQKK